MVDNKDLIFKYLADECSEDEKTSLHEELSSNTDFEQDLKKVEKIWNLAQLSEEDISLDEASSFDSIQEKLGWKEESTNDKPDPKVVELGHRSNLQWLKIAAVLLIAVGLIGYFAKFQTGISGTSTVEVANSEKESIEVLLPDGSVVELNNGASITYQDNLGSEKTRSVFLKGEAFFDVKRNVESPFVIKTAENTEVKVLGTSFNVKSDVENTIVSVMTGKVEVSNLTSERQVIVVKGQRAIYQNKEVSKQDSYDANELAWKTGVLEFRSHDMSYVIDHLNNYYSVDINATNSSVENCKITTRLDHKSLDESLEIISTILGVSVEQRDGKIILTGNGC